MSDEVLTVPITLRLVNASASADSLEMDALKAITRLQSELNTALYLKGKLITDTGKGCSVCGGTPVVHVPDEGSDSYWLCGGCVAISLDERRDALSKLDLAESDRDNCQERWEELSDKLTKAEALCSQKND